MTTEFPPRSSNAPASFLRRIVLRLMLVLLLAGVVVAVINVLRGAPLGDTLARLLTTTPLSALFAALAHSCVDAAEKRPTSHAYLGALVASVAVALVFVGAWFEQFGAAWWWKSMSSASLYSVAFWRSARLSLADVGVAGALVVRATVAACVGIATIVSIFVLRERADPTMVRVMNALFIVAIGGHVAVPIFARLHRRGGGSTP